MNNDIKADNRTFKLTPLIISLAVLLSPLISLFIAPDVGATTTYDGVFNNLPTALKIERKQDSCPAVDITNSWGGMITDPSKWLGTATGDKTGAIDAFNTAKNNGTGWAASQVVSNGNIGSVMTSPDPLNNDTKYQMAGTNFVFITYTPDPVNSVNFISYDTVRMAYMTSSDGVLPTYNLMIFQDNNCNPVVYGVTQKSYIAYGNQVVAVQLLADDGIWTAGTAKPLFINSTINYPAFYAGAIPPANFAPAVERSPAVPIISYKISGMDIIISGNTSTSTNDNIVSWSAYVDNGVSDGNPDKSEVFYTGTDGLNGTTENMVDSDITFAGHVGAGTSAYNPNTSLDNPSNIRVTVPTKETYYLKLVVTTESGLQSATYVQVGVDGLKHTGTSIEGDIIPSIYKDCSVYGADNIIGGFGCHLDNFRIWIVDMITGLFVPDTTMIAASFDNMYAMLVQKLGFLLYPFTFVFRFFQSILDINGPVPCTIDLDKVYGVQYDLDICSFEHNLPTFFFFAQSLLQGITSMGLMWQIRKKFDEVMIR